MAEGGFNAALANLDPNDSWEVHARDTLIAGSYLNDQNLVEILAKEAPERILDLENFGAIFSRTPDGFIMQRPFGHQTYRRTCYAGDRTGHEIMATLTEELNRREIIILEDVFATSLLRDNNRVAGVTFIDIRTGNFKIIKASSVVIATGGAGRIYEVTTNAQTDIGSGYAMAYRANVELMDMEQFQFHPTGIAVPPSARGRLVTEGVRGEGGILLNNDGERFMKRYNPQLMELAGRDEVTRSILTEILEGRGTENGAVFLDISFLPSRIIEERLPTMLKDFLDFGIDIRNEPMEVTPTAHHMMGGIKITGRAETNLKGFFAAGEVVGGIHGGNRLGGNALADTQVFGRIAGNSAAKYAASVSPPKLDRDFIKKEYSRIRAPIEREEGVSSSSEINQLQKNMWSKAGIFRNEQDLISALQFIKKQQERVDSQLMVNNQATRYNTEWINSLELYDMLLVSEMLVRSAICRKESRGAHYRTDYPTPNHELWLINIIIQKLNQQMVLEKKPIIITKWKPT